GRAAENNDDTIHAGRLDVRDDLSEERAVAQPKSLLRPTEPGRRTGTEHDAYDGSHRRLVRPGAAPNTIGTLPGSASCVGNPLTNNNHQPVCRRNCRGLETCDARRRIAALGVGFPRVGVETRLRATEGRVAAANGLDVKERWVDIASPPVRVRLLESGTGDPVLFINGISAPGIGMAPLAGRLPGRCHLLVDLPGHGLSPPYLWRGAPIREQAVNVIAGVLGGLGIDQVTLVGNSLGGLFALWFALDQPSRVARAVIVGQPAVAIQGSRGNLTMGLLAAPVLGRVVTWMARLPSPRLAGRWGMREAAGAHAARQVSNDIVDLHLLSLRLPGQAASF